MHEAELLKITEAAKIAGICRTTAYGLISSKQWPVVRIGTAVRIPRRELMAWIAVQVAEQNPELDSFKPAASRAIELRGGH